MITTLKIDNGSILVTKIYDNGYDFQKKLGLVNKLYFTEASGKDLDDFYSDPDYLVFNELEPRNRELITRFYNDPKCETIYMDLLEQYYGDNATGETYIYIPPNLPENDYLKNLNNQLKSPRRKKFLGIF